MRKEEFEIMNERVFDSSIELKDNALLRRRPELFREWDFEKNDELDLNVYKITQGSGKFAWWNCPKCKSPYDMMINKRTTRNQNCPYCAGVRVNSTNSLASLRPNLAKEWHSILNGNLTPHNVPCGCNEKVWWFNSKCGHKWEAIINDRTKKVGTACPYCSNHELLVGFNDMWSTNLELAKLLLNPEDGYKYMQSSGKRVDWKCKECTSIIPHERVNNIYHRGLLCHNCSDGVPFGEKFIYNLLREANIKFDFDETQDWSKGRRYDFYLPEYNWIIETHGIQHYIQTNRKNARSLEEEQENDRLKEHLAKDNGIDKYIILDARESTVEWIKNSILNSDLMKIVEDKDIDFERIGQLASKSLIEETCNLWMNGIQNTLEIAKMIKLSRNTIVNYLKRGAEIGWCDYCPTDETKKRSANAGKKNGIPVVQLSKSGEFIREWNSARDASTAISNSPTSKISCVCRNKRNLTLGFKWMFKDDYNKLIISSR